MMEIVTFSTSLDIPLLGVGVSVNYSHVSNGVKALRLSRSDFDALIRFVGDLPYSPDAMVLQIQAVFNCFSLNFFIKSFFSGCMRQRCCKNPGSGGSPWIQLLHPRSLPRVGRGCYLWDPLYYGETVHPPRKPCSHKVQKIFISLISGLPAFPLI